MNDYLNIFITILFAGISVVMFTRSIRNSKKIMIHDKQWSSFRMIFVAIGVVSLINLVVGEKTIYDYARIISTFIVVSSLTAARDGIGEDGVVSNGKFYPWKIVRSYDYEVAKSLFTVYFTIESTNAKKPDEYTTKAVDFDLVNQEYVKEFLRMNQGRKKTRMKKKSK